MPKRCRFSKEEEFIMKSIVQNESGRTGGKVFWQRIKDSQGIFERHSAESLKFHWKLMTKKQKPSKQPTKPDQTQNSAPQEENIINNIQNDNDIKKEIKNENIENKTNEVLYAKYSGWIYTNHSDQEYKMTHMGEKEIGRLFERLFETCSKVAGTELDKEVVVMVLDEHQGKVNETIKYFQRMRSINMV